MFQISVFKGTSSAITYEIRVVCPLRHVHLVHTEQILTPGLLQITSSKSKCRTIHRDHGRSVLVKTSVVKGP